MIQPLGSAPAPGHGGERRRGWPWARTACLLVGSVLLADALVLMAMGFFMVGVTVPAALGLVLCFLGMRWHRVRDGFYRMRWGAAAWRTGWLFLAAWVCSVAVFWVVLAQQVDALGQADPAAAPQAIVVLGSGTPKGQPSPALRARLDTAHALAAAHPHAWVVVSGGVDFGETLSEGEVMGNYLRQQGLDPARILQEERSTSTQENLRFSLPVLQAHGFNQQAHTLLLVTSDFHALRARLIARREGYSHIQSASAPTPLPQRYAAWLREYFAFISGWLLKEY